MRLVAPPRLLLVSCVFTLALGGACHESPESSYASYEEARRAGAVERGWIPSLVPAGALNIREKHDLDTNEVWGVFDFADADVEALQKQLRPLAKGFLLGRTIGSGGVSWWPASLRGSLTETVLNDGALAFFTGSDGFFAVVDWKLRRCYFWHKRSWAVQPGS